MSGGRSKPLNLFWSKLAGPGNQKATLDSSPCPCIFQDPSGALAFPMAVSGSISRHALALPSGTPHAVHGGIASWPLVGRGGGRRSVWFHLPGGQNDALHARCCRSMGGRKVEPQGWLWPGPASSVGPALYVHALVLTWIFVVFYYME